ncbi:uncharacterized protein LOC128556410 [Mercenaria mercenaria]|uniref:uncharacterized protein LOC128556410 n=1 Tax=Mercenaria mercenaria TaxID=6596 RepID=UPI00234F00F4|nr:uncharacterized protein LOC128556410 [Mercenaria mercenaria]
MLNFGISCIELFVKFAYERKITMPRLSEHERNHAVGMHLVGTSKREVWRLFNCHASTISRLKTRYQHTNAVRDRPRPDYPRVTTARQDKQLRVNHLRNSFTTATDTARHFVGRYGSHFSTIHPNTVRSRLRVAGLRCRRSLKSSRLTMQHRAARLR